jgi:hypothetical protein
MGLLDFFKSKPAQGTAQAVSQSVPVPQPQFEMTTTNTPPQKINLSKINLVKSREVKVGINLSKKSNEPITANVVFVLDVSGSMQGEFSNSRQNPDSRVQEILERIYPIAMHMTKNLPVREELDCYLFSSKVSDKLPKVNMNNFGTYVVDVILAPKADHRTVLWGGTSYAPAMSAIYKAYKNSSVPTYVIFITDGDNSDHGQSERVVIDSSSTNIFWQFVGIGNSSFSFLEGLDNMPVVQDQRMIQNLDTSKGRVVDNANFFQLNDIMSVSDDELYKRILNEFPDWIKKAKAIGIVK